MDRRLSYLSSLSRWRRKSGIVKVAVLFILGFCYFLLSSSSKAPAASIIRPPLPPRDGSASTLQKIGIDPASLQHLPEQPGEVKPIKPPLEGNQDVLQAVPPSSKNQHKPPPGSISAAGSDDVASIRKALLNVFDIMPEEGRMDDLLMPLIGTGTKRLRDVGSKAREFKVYLKAWEGLHLIFGSNSANVRDDILRFILERHSELSLPGMTLAQTLHAYEMFRSLITNLGDLLFPWTAPYFANHMTLHASFYGSGRGIVLSAGQDQVPYLLATIPAMRRLGCTLPIEIMYLGDDDISEDYREVLDEIPGVVTRDVKQMVRDAGWDLAGWASKPFAMLLSSFREVMFIDADAVFLRNPEILFEDPQYIEAGALFFKDRSIFPESKRRWLREILPKPISKSVQSTRLWTGESGHQQESGVVVVDKWRHFVEMLVVTRMNGPDRDGNKDEGIEGVYDMVYGDKETFWLSWELLRNSDYAFHDGYRGSMGAIHHGPIKPDELHDDDDQSEVLVEAPMGLTKEQFPSSFEETDNEPAPHEAEGESDADERLPIQEDDEFGTRLGDQSTGHENVPSAHADDLGMIVPSKKPESLEGGDSSSTLPDLPNLKRVTKRSVDTESATIPKQEDYTICAPQLLHMDGAGQPLWFNGWMARNKFKEPSLSEPAQFDVYIVEPDKAGKKEAWQLIEDNIACLTNVEVVEFTTREREVLDMVMGIAAEVGALGARKSGGG